jgi:uncharacterized protein YchJ
MNCYCCSGRKFEDCCRPFISGERKPATAEELIDLTLAVTTINAWNRISIAFRVEVGTYQPASQAATK